MKEKNVVIDSNLLIKSKLSEDESKKASKLIRNYITNDYVFIEPPIFEIEIYSVLIARGGDVKEVYSMINQLKKDNLKVVDMEFEYFNKACEIVESGNNKSGYPSLYDAIYHAIAVVEDIDFITADKKHYEKTKHFGNIKLFPDYRP